MNNIIHASPTKEFFIEMLTKDIKLERAIIDLIDNSIDGAKSLTNNGDFKNLWVRLTINDKEFIIEDNCGGFSLQIAKDYAFMFGRPNTSVHEVKHSVGRFGVGMKRALFKIGRTFEVESRHKRDHFQVTVDVNEWSQKANEWNFEYVNVDETNKNIEGHDGTYIKVTGLNDAVLDEFVSSVFLANLTDEIQRTLSFSLDKNLSITLNKVPLKKSKLSFLEFSQLKPFYKNIQVDGVDIKVYAGIGKASPDLAGWYIYCNERLVLERDKTNLTGWEGRRIGESTVQKFHHIYAMFRGVVFFSSDDSKKLPMTTTKTGIDSNSTVYKAARHIMVDAMAQVIYFLKTFDSDEQRNEVISASNEIDVIQLSCNTYESKFVYPKIEKFDDIDETFTSISYKAEKTKVKIAKNFFKVASNREVGEKAFDYFFKMEGENL